MAYAQLAGLPAYYGLYAAFLPPMVAALFGSSRQLATGPVAVVSLMTATALEPLAIQGSSEYCAYAILLAVMVGLVQFSFGLLRLGIVVNFLSHPVVLGFTNAAAIIIATSQLSKFFGVYVDKANYHFETIYRVLECALAYTHLPTLGMAALAIGIMAGVGRYMPRVPNVLVAVVVTTLLSVAVGFERTVRVDITQIQSSELRHTIDEYNQAISKIEELSKSRNEKTASLRQVETEKGPDSTEAIGLRHVIALSNVSLMEWEESARVGRRQLRNVHLKAHNDAEEGQRFFVAGEVPPGVDVERRIWRPVVRNQVSDEESILLSGGGAVVARIPPGLPKLSVPKFDLSIASQLLPVAFIISLLGFMEAISIAKAMAARTGQRLNPNQELIGQGLANILGAAGQSYPVSGSFSRSAVNISGGAQTGMSSVFTSGVVVIVLLFFTRYLYHLPQAVLAAIIMMAVIRLIDIPGMARAWRAQKTDGVVAAITFLCTLGFAPHLEKGITIGVVLSLGVSLYRHMRPAVACLAKHPDGSYRDAGYWNLEECRYIATIRFNGALFFANAGFLEEKILARVASMPELRHLLIVSNAISHMDASGEDMLASIVDRLHAAGYGVSFSGLNEAIHEIMDRTGLSAKIGQENMYRNMRQAVQAIHSTTHAGTTERVCPLLEACTRTEPGDENGYGF